MYGRPLIYSVPLNILPCEKKNVILKVFWDDTFLYVCTILKLYSENATVDWSWTDNLPQAYKCDLYFKLISVTVEKFKPSTLVQTMC